LYSALNVKGNKLKEDDMGGIHITHEMDEKYKVMLGKFQI
jgi:hypothetical protein